MKMDSDKRITPPNCKLCSAPTEPFDVCDFTKFCSAEPYSHGFSGVPVFYYRCGNCECTFTDFFDNWSTEDFRRFVYNDDYILVDPDYADTRPKETTREWLIRFDMLRGVRVLDYGAGSGSFAQAMNAHGYDFSSYDPFSSPTMPDGQFEAVTAFEVVEHSPRPLETFGAMLDYMGERKIIIVGQSLQPEDIMTVRANWWYIAPRNGHCTTYSERTFRWLAEQHGFTCAFNTGYVGLFSHPDDDLSRAIISRIVNW